MAGGDSSKKVRIISRNQTTYREKKTGNIREGFEVGFEYLATGEEFHVNIPDLKPDTVYNAIMDMVADLDATNGVEF